MKYCFGVDIGGTTVKMGLFEESGRFLTNGRSRQIRLRKEGNPSEYCGFY